MGSLFSRLSSETAKSYGLVLTAMGIPSRTEWNGTYWTLTVAVSHRRAAVSAIALYLKENPPVPPEKTIADPPRATSISAVFVVAALVLIHILILPGYEHEVFVDALGADAGRIIDGELYRSVTALLLHADGVHLLGNVAALALFGTVVAGAYGWGMGWLLILVCGAAGNLSTALWYQQHHTAVGASTAVFGAVGLCAVLAAMVRARGAPRSWRTWLPLAGGFALLGFLGTAPRSDLMAHLFGFLCGLLVGWIDLRFRSYHHWPIQLGSAAGAVATVAACWLQGVSYSG